MPTWNYATFHAWGKPVVIDDPDWLRRQIDSLTRTREGLRPEPWKVEDAPEDFVAAQIKGIIGVEITIGRIEGKWKVSQNRPEPDRDGVAAGYREQGASGIPMADLVAERGKPG